MLFLHIYSFNLILYHHYSPTGKFRMYGSQWEPKSGECTFDQWWKVHIKIPSKKLMLQKCKISKTTEHNFQGTDKWLGNDRACSCCTPGTGEEVCQWDITSPDLPVQLEKLAMAINYYFCKFCQRKLRYYFYRFANAKLASKSAQNAFLLWLRQWWGSQRVVVAEKKLFCYH